MTLLKREEWFELSRRLDWTPKYVAEEELFPPDFSTGGSGSAADWESWDEPYKVSYREYMNIQRDKEASVYGVKTALERSKFIERADPRWKSVLKAHYGAVALGEYSAGMAEARMGRYAPTSAWRNVSILGLLDELRHTQIQLIFPHGFIKESPQWDWAQKTYHTNEWAAIAARHLLDDILLTASAEEIAVQLTFVFETGFTNLQFLGMAMDAMQEGDVEFSTLLQSIQTDEARHSQQGSAVLDILTKLDQDKAQYYVDKSFWRTWRLFDILTGTAMDYYTPLEHRRTSFKEFILEWVADQFERSIEDHGLKLPWYWDIFLKELEYNHHSYHMGIWFWRPTVWFDPAAGVSPEERKWLVSKYPDWEESFGHMWDVITENIRSGKEERTLPQTFPVMCNICQLPVSSRTNWTTWDREGGLVDWHALTHDHNGRRYFFCSEPCKWIFETGIEKYAPHMTLVDRFLAGQIDPPDLNGAINYMGITPEVAGKDALDFSWARQ
jgi:toluene monooxygenase system protein A